MTMAYNAANQIATILQGATLTTATYDANGNLVGENAAGSLTSYVSDNENRLTSIQFPDGTRSIYSYAGDGLRRTAFEAGGSPATMIWCELAWGAEPLAGISPRAICGSGWFASSKFRRLLSHRGHEPEVLSPWW